VSPRAHSLCCAVLLTACSGTEDNATGADASSDTATFDDAATSGDTPVADSKTTETIVGPTTCDGPTPELHLDGPGGTGIIRGTITLPDAASGKVVMLMLGTSSYLGLGTVLGSATPAGTTLRYEIAKLALNQSFYVQALVSNPATSKFDEGGYGGFYAGTLAAPVGPAAATPVRLVATAPAFCAADFGLGPMPCYATWGSTCTKDAECRETFCDCNGGSRSGFLAGACDPATKVCRQVPTVAGKPLDCDAHCGAAGASGPPRMASCTNN
jgi:hypothetical protein